MKNEIIYSSGINIWSQADLATLSVFYDKVFLPSTDDKEIENMVEFSRPRGSSEPYRLNLTGVWLSQFETEDGCTHELGKYARDWAKRNNSLFVENVLERLDPISDPRKSDYLDRFMGGRVENFLLELPHSLTSISGEFTSQKESGKFQKLEKYNSIVYSTEEIFIWQDHYLHLFREDLNIPQIFLSREKYKNHQIIKALLSQTVINAFVPSLSALEADDILEVRRRVADNREGFSLHMQKLSATIDGMNHDNIDIDEIQKFANSLIQTEIIPDYYEFIRQLKSERLGIAGSALDISGKIFEIDSAPWTPKFYGDLVKAIGSTVFREFGDKNSLTNQAQAFKFIRKLENHALLQEDK